ncbi:MAG: hypothetical protein CL804_09650 [Citromicrobium sp.]|nr:hypothetical protein [Citromicrobium sp.]|tara:strand:- start:5578 stop:5940 length:363 start_codon:yes stop_codon:yes gene_type:complete
MSIKTILRGALATGLAFGMASNASAAPQYCTGTISYSYIDTTGAVYIWGTWRSAYTQVCDINSEWQSVPTDICMAWLARLDAAVALNKSVIIYYADATSCAALPSAGSSIAPGYVLLMNS